MAGKKKNKDKRKKKGAAEDFSLFDYLLEKHGPVMRTAAVADLLHMHPNHVRNMAKDGELPAIRVGSRWIFPTAKIAALVNGADAYDC